MIIDAQIHIWEADRPDRPWPKQGADGRTATPQRAVPMSAAEALDAMDRAGVDRAILVPPSWEGDRNDVALASAHAHPARFAVMGRLNADQDPTSLSSWMNDPAMLGARIILSTDAPWVREGASHCLWEALAAAGIPVALAPAGNMQLVTRIAQAHPRLSIMIDHMGARVHHKGAVAFAQIDQVVQLATLPNVAVKATSLPSYSARQRPWPDVLPYLRRLFDAYGAQRLFWGSDLSRLPCPYSDLVTTFRDAFGWLAAKDRDAVMGMAIREWLNWK